MRGRQDTDKSQERLGNNPGPGKYDTHYKFGMDAKAATFRGKPEWKPLDKNPGPCDYDTRTDYTMPRTPK